MVIASAAALLASRAVAGLSADRERCAELAERSLSLATALVPALGYDAARLLFDAMKRSASLDGKTLAASIASTKGFNGVTGVISMDANRDAHKSAVIVQMKGGVPVYVTTIAPPE